MPIKLLSQHLINQIAAGEVIERPSSAIKELMENSIDAEATEISVRIIDAGKSFISVSDNGIGMDKSSLEMSVLSHATSKLNSENLFNIHTCGFRGEALPSIASVSRMSISSAQKSSDGWRIQLEGASNFGVSPINQALGTTIEVRDLFFATPARLKFLKSNAYESDSCFSIFNRIALAFKDISLKFTDGNNEKANYRRSDTLQDRVQDIFGEAFVKNIFEINVEHNGLKLYGYIGVPTFNKASASHQYFFVNKRFVKDKIFASALRSAYSGLNPYGRYPVAILFLDMPYDKVDVNAHPAKTEIRFRDAEKIRYFLVSELKKSLSSFGAALPTTEVIDKFYDKQKINEFKDIEEMQASFQHAKAFPSQKKPETYGDSLKNFFSTTSKKNNQLKEIENIYAQEDTIDIQLDTAYTPQENCASEKNGNISLGNAISQINNMYVVSENDGGLVIVDQHAAAERIMLEMLKNNLKLDSQQLLIPEVHNFSESEIDLLKDNDKLLQKLGIHMDVLSQSLISINSLPAILETSNAKAIIVDIIDELSMFGSIYSIEEKIHGILSSISCHSSIRAGKKLSIDEMNHLLRLMETTANIAQCCHGRPSYIKISIKDLNKLFIRS